MDEQIKKWLALVKDYFGIDSLIYKSKEREQVRARSVAMYLLRKHLQFSHKQIAAKFKKDRTTVTHAIKQVEYYYMNDVEDIEDFEKTRRQESLF